MWDIHCHLLANIDDGASSLEEAFLMAKMAVEDGIHHSICTSHLTPCADIEDLIEQRAQARALLQKKLAENSVALTLETGAELLLTEYLLPSVQKYSALRLAGGNAFLFEITPFIPLQTVLPLLFSAGLAGLQTVFAHPERYPQTPNDFALLHKMQEYGVLFQLTAMSLTGGFGNRVCACAEQIIKTFPESLVLASDAHNTTLRTPTLQQGYAALKKLSPRAYDAALENVQRIVQA